MAEQVEAEAIDEKQEQALQRLEGRAKEQMLERNRLEKGELAQGEEPATERGPYSGAAMLNLTKAQQDALLAPVPIDDIEIRPDGNIYLPQVFYRKILFDIFGPGNWALVPMSDPKGLPAQGMKQTVIQQFQLRIYGKFAAEAWGEGDYYSNQSSTSKATAAESAKSNALVRCCKDLGIAIDCWDKKFAEQFKRERCILVNNKWQLKNAQA